MALATEGGRAANQSRLEHLLEEERPELAGWPRSAVCFESVRASACTLRASARSARLRAPRVRPLATPTRFYLAFSARVLLAARRARLT